MIFVVKLQNAKGMLFGGVVAAVAERVAIGCATTILGVGQSQLCVGQITVSYLAPAPPNVSLFNFPIFYYFYLLLKTTVRFMFNNHCNFESQTIKFIIPVWNLNSYHVFWWVGMTGRNSGWCFRDKEWEECNSSCTWFPAQGIAAVGLCEPRNIAQNPSFKSLNLHLSAKCYTNISSIYSHNIVITVHHN